MVSRRDWDEEVDFLVGGAGAGGLTGAIVAKDAGLETVLLEKSSVVGGGAAVSDGEVWAPASHIAKREGIDDSVTLALQYLDALKGNFPVDEPVRNKWIEAARESILYLEEKAGVKWRIIRGLSDVLYGVTQSGMYEGRYVEVDPIHASELGNWSDKVLRSPFIPFFVTNEEMFALGGASTLKDWPKQLVRDRIDQEILCQGPGLIAYLLKACVLDRKIPLFTGSPIVRIFSEEGVVTGVESVRDGKPFFVRAKRGVLLNVGGYDWHPIYPFLYEQIPEWHSVMPPSIEGDMITLAGDVGAAVVPFKIYSAMPGFHVPGEEWFGKDLYRQLMFESGLPHSIVVNKQGHRFADESYFQDFGQQACLHDKTDGFVNFPCFIVFDESYREKYPLGSIEPGRPFPAGFAQTGTTLEELARKMGIEAEGLLGTVKEFNEFAKTGVDRQFGRGSKAWANQYVGDLRHKPNANLGTVEKSPFYGIRLTFVGIGHNGGYCIDVNASVLNTRWEPIKGLYACGNCVAFVELGPTYQDGACLSRSIAFGLVAARHAAASGN